MLRAVARTFNAIFKGGYLSRQDWLFRYVSFWYEYDVETMSDTCRLRALLIGSVIKTLLVLALAIVLLAAIVALILAIIDDPQLGLFVGGIGGPIAVALFLILAAAQHWSIFEMIFETVMDILQALIVLVVAFFLIWVLGDVSGGILASAFDINYPGFTQSGNFPTLAEMYTGVVAIAVIAIAAIAALAIVLVVSGWFRRFQAWAAETGFWLWLKGWACQELELVD